MNPKLKNWLKEKYVLVKKKFLFYWTKISEENRKGFFITFHSSFNYLQNALLLSVLITLLTGFSYFKSVICVWVLLPFFEHYYIWLREKWKDDLVK